MLGAVLLLSCSGRTDVAGPDDAATAVTPSVSSISPLSFTTTTSLQTMTLSGSGFARDAALTLVPPSGAPFQSTASRLIFVSASQLSYKFNSGGVAGPWSVSVVLPDGRRSNPQGFVVVE